MDRLSQTAVLCHLNIDKPETKPISKQFHLGGIPTVVILDPKGQEVDRIIGYEGNRSEWLKVLLASLYGIDTIGDLQVRYAAKPDLKLAHQLAQKFLDRGDGASSLEWVEKTRSLKPDSETSSKLTLIEGEATLFTDPPKGADMLLRLATIPGSPLALDAFQDLSAFYKRQARNATSPEEKQKAKAARLEVFHKVVAAQPSDPEVLTEYAWYCAGEGIELDKALAAAKKAVELKPKDGDTLSTLAEVEFKSGQKDEAVKTIDKAIAAEPDEQSFKEQKEKFLKGEAQK
jgi:tetratricopeptide (TPR) repeat protein